MLKKSLIVIAIILLGIGVYFIFMQNNAKQSTTLPELPESEIHDDNIEEQVEEEGSENEDSSTEEDSDAGSFITDGIQKVFEAFQNKEYQVTAIGDSLTQGVGDETDSGGFIGILERQLNHGNQTVNFDNFGKRGNRSDQLLERLDEEEIVASLETSDMVLITIGANDIMQVARENFTNLQYDVFAEELITYEERLQTILQTIREFNSNANIYLIGFYNPFLEYFPEVRELDQIVTEWNQISKLTVEQDDNGTFIPTKDLFENTGEVHLFADDHFHPNYEGYQLMADRILQYITEPQN